MTVCTGYGQNVLDRIVVTTFAREVQSVAESAIKNVARVTKAATGRWRHV